MGQAPPARPSAYAWEGKISDLSRVQEQTEDLTWNLEERGSAFVLSRFHARCSVTGVGAADERQACSMPWGFLTLNVGSGKI